MLFEPDLFHGSSALNALEMLGCVLKDWLGRQDSNLGMAVPKTAALPLGDAPTLASDVKQRGYYTHALRDQYGKRTGHVHEGVNVGSRTTMLVLS
jgi:hypothetical protein